MDARSPELTALRGQTGRLRLLKVRYDGFERAERLVPVAVIGRDGQPLRLVDAEARFFEACSANRECGNGHDRQ